MTVISKGRLSSISYEYFDENANVAFPFKGNVMMLQLAIFFHKNVTILCLFYFSLHTDLNGQVLRWRELKRMLENLERRVNYLHQQL